jgi:hypothetical protein
MAREKGRAGKGYNSGGDERENPQMVAFKNTFGDPMIEEQKDESKLEGYYVDNVDSISEPPADALDVGFQHNLHRGLKSRQIAMVALAKSCNNLG